MKQEPGIDKAIEFLLECFVKNPFNNSYCFEIGSLYFKHQQFNYAIAWLKKAIQLAPDHSEARDLLRNCESIQCKTLANCDGRKTDSCTNRKLKVLFVGDYFYPAVGGAEKSALTIMQSLCDDGHNCMAICLGEGKGTQFATIPVRYVKYFNEIELLIAAIRPDILLTQLTIAESAIRAAAAYNIPSILFVRSLEYFCSSPLKMSQCDRYCLICEEKTGKNIDRIAYQKMFESAGRIVCNSIFIQQLTLQYYGVNAEVVYPPVTAREHHSVNSIQKFILMSNPEPHKGGELFYSICKKLPEYSFMTVGDGGLNNVDNCIDFGFTDPLLFFSVAKLVIIPSQWPEPFGRIALEAMINGIPVIASKTGGLPELIGDAGILIEDFTNVDVWVDVIRNIYKNEKLYESCKEKGLRQALKFENVKQLQQLKGLITKVSSICTTTSDYRVLNYYTSKYENLPYSKTLFPDGAQRVAMLCSMIPDGKSYVDIGCADGIHMELLSRRGIWGVGVDISWTNILNGNKDFPSSVFIHGYAEDLPFSDDIFDIAILGDILNCVRDPTIVIMEALRVSDEVIGSIWIGENEYDNIKQFNKCVNLLELFDSTGCSFQLFTIDGSILTNDFVTSQKENLWIFFRLKKDIYNADAIMKCIEKDDRYKIGQENCNSLENGKNPALVHHNFFLSTLASGTRVLEMYAKNHDIFLFSSHERRMFITTDIGQQNLRYRKMIADTQCLTVNNISNNFVDCFKDSSIDTIFLIDIPCYIRNLRSYLSDAMRVLGDRGKIIIDVPDGIVKDHLQKRIFSARSLTAEISQYSGSLQLYQNKQLKRITCVVTKESKYIVDKLSLKSQIEKEVPISIANILWQQAFITGINIVGPVDDDSAEGVCVRDVINVVRECRYPVSINHFSQNKDCGHVNLYRSWKDPVGFEMIYSISLIFIKLNDIDHFFKNPPKWFRNEGKFIVFVSDVLLSDDQLRSLKFCDAVIAGPMLLKFESNNINKTFNEEYALSRSLLTPLLLREIVVEAKKLLRRNNCAV